VSRSSLRQSAVFSTLTFVSAYEQRHIAFVGAADQRVWSTTQRCCLVPGRLLLAVSPRYGVERHRPLRWARTRDTDRYVQWRSSHDLFYTKFSYTQFRQPL